MDGLTLLAEARDSGLEVRADGDRLVVRGPKEAEAIALRLIDHKAEVLPLVANPPSMVGWDPEMTRLIGWFLATEPPARPFKLAPGVTVIHPGRCWECLRGDISTGPGKARAYTGALQTDLRRLHELFGPQKDRP